MGQLNEKENVETYLLLNLYYSFLFNNLIGVNHISI